MIGTADEIIMRLLPIRDSSKRYDIKEHRDKRSLTQNAYYWVLLGKVADKLRLPKPEVHNRMLRDFGQILIVDGQAARVVLPDTDAAEQRAISMETVHLKLTSQVCQFGDGKMYRTYVIMRGSHDYSTEEMTHLLDGMIEEAKQQGIETLPPDELAHMRELEHDKQENKGVRDQPHDKD